MKDSHSAESNEKSYFRLFWFVLFGLCLIAFTSEGGGGGSAYGDTPGVPPGVSKVAKFTGKMHIDMTMIF